MKKLKGKLSLDRETLVTLQSNVLDGVAGGASLPTTTTTTTTTGPLSRIPVLCPSLPRCLGGAQGK